MTRLSRGGALSRSVVMRVAALCLLLLAAQRAVPTLRRDLARFRVDTSVQTSVPGVIAPGRVVLTEQVPPRRLAVGDVIAYRHPLRERAPVHGRVTQIEPVPMTASYLVRLDVGDPSGEPWFAEFYGGVWRVVFDLPAPPWYRSRA